MEVNTSLHYTSQKAPLAKVGIPRECLAVLYVTQYLAHSF